MAVDNVSSIDELNYLPEMPEHPRNIVSIGTGGIVQGSHYPAYKLAGYPVVACFDQNLETAEKAASSFGVPKVCKSIAELVDVAEKTDAVYDIAVPANCTADILRQLPDGAGVLMQKPMGESISEAREILSICHSKSLTAGVNFQLRQSPYMIAARDLIAKGVIGEIVDIDHRLVGTQPWNLWPFLFPKDRVEINYHSIHYIDNIRSLIGDPTAVWCKTMQHPKMRELAQTRTSIIMDYGPDLRANLHINFNHDYSKKYQESTLKIEGLKGAIRVKLGLMYDYPEGEPDRVEYVTYADNGEWQELPVRGSWFNEAFIGTMGGLMKKLDDSDYEYMNSVEDAFHTMCVVEACYQSSSEGGTPVDYAQE
ncbi:Gfo/Idh/MocA family protein [Olsenella phocaeensis]|uniref:Gfo/Idh/MocA family protein n=1 Tax=Olsenella phocaeensis TaxID=1852385 RepID=UPI0009308830|nr:Gfo/Idh/MocA family oxidoreductase [Olsenella phocaeensis]